MKLLNNHYFSTLSCYNTRLLDSLQAKFLRLPSRSRPFILPCSCKFSVCPKNRVSVFRFMKKTCIFLYFFLSQKRCKECALAHSGISRDRLRHVSALRERASSRSVFLFHRTPISHETKKSYECNVSSSIRLLFHAQVYSMQPCCRVLFGVLGNSRFTDYIDLDLSRIL